MPQTLTFEYESLSDAERCFIRRVLSWSALAVFLTGGAMALLGVDFPQRPAWFAEWFTVALIPGGPVIAGAMALLLQSIRKLRIDRMVRNSSGRTTTGITGPDILLGLVQWGVVVGTVAFGQFVLFRIRSTAPLSPHAVAGCLAAIALVLGGTAGGCFWVHSRWVKRTRRVGGDVHNGLFDVLLVIFVILALSALAAGVQAVLAVNRSSY